MLSVLLTHNFWTKTFYSQLYLFRTIFKKVVKTVKVTLFYGTFRKTQLYYRYIYKKNGVNINTNFGNDFKNFEIRNPSNSPDF